MSGNTETNHHPGQAGTPAENAPANTKEMEKTTCPVCPRHCRLRESEAGFCRARRAQDGAVVCENYGRVTALSLDPIEKKPLAHFHPGSYVLSAGSYGCNLCCPFCQNHDIAQAGSDIFARRMAPEELVEMALELQRDGNIGLAFTYNEPAVGYEFVRDTARLAIVQGLKNVVVTNGYLCAGPLEELLTVVDAFNIDLKCFTEDGYRRLGGQLAPVQQTIARVAQTAHLEVTTLVVPGLSDSEEEMEREAVWLAGLSPEIPLHLSRYFPRWQATGAPTDVAVLKKLEKIARKYLRHVHLGNV